MRISQSRTLQISLFATGCSGIVAEFVLSTLATYLIGNATFQWTMIMSIMLFAMGLGSRYSRFFEKNILDTFILVEFLLSALCAMSAVITFGLSSQMESRELVIYPLAFFIGGLIGLEIPLVTRLNSIYQELRTNISSVLEMDYFGSLLGGILFAFVFLPLLGFIYTPVLLGSVNFIVASWLMWRFFNITEQKRLLITGFSLCLITIICAAIFASPMILFSEQKKYKDTIIYSKQTKYQKIVITKWKEHHWLYINGQEQFSSFDEERYHEPLVHPAMQLAPSRENILILGGGDGLAAREVLKYKDVKSLTLVDLDPVMTDLGRNHPVMVKLNNKSLNHEKIHILNMDASAFLDKNRIFFNVIIIDLPDPDSMDIMHLYSDAFYREVKRNLAVQGIMVTQATSPYFARKAFLCINKTIASAGFRTLPYHNQVPTLGEWGWVLACKAEEPRRISLKKEALGLKFNNINTDFLNNDAMIAMLHFGKDVFKADSQESIKNNITINTKTHPVLYKYYAQGDWGIY